MADAPRGPIGTESNNPVIDQGTLACTEMPSPSQQSKDQLIVVNNKSIGAHFDIDTAVKHLNDNAHETSQGQCAKYVRQAIEAGGVTISNRPLYAKDYGPKLTELGFKKIDSKGYIPQKGDIVVLQPPEGQSAGHMQIYNGEIWVSDFKQSSGIYPGPAYRKEKVAYEIYRP